MAVLRLALRKKKKLPAAAESILVDPSGRPIRLSARTSHYTSWAIYPAAQKDMYFPSCGRNLSFSSESPTESLPQQPPQQRFQMAQNRGRKHSCFKCGKEYVRLDSFKRHEDACSGAGGINEQKFTYRSSHSTTLQLAFTYPLPKRPGKS